MLQGKSEALVIVSAVLLAMSCVTIALRCYVRLQMVRRFGWDDGLMVVALVLFTGMMVPSIIGAIAGMGQKTEFFEDRPDKVRTALMAWWVAEFFYSITCPFAKLSVLVTLHRVTIERAHRWTIYLTAVLSILLGSLIFFLITLQCRPVSTFWNRSGTGTCAHPTIIARVVYAYSAGEALTDLVIGILPWFILRPLHIERKTKATLIIVLGLGCSASVAVIVRIPYFALWESPDEQLYVSADLTIWSAVEAALGLTAGSLVVLRPLLQAIQQKLSTRNTQSEDQLAQVPSGPNRGIPAANYHFFLQQEAG